MDSIPHQGNSRMNENRKRTLKEGTYEAGAVAYWMSRDQRVSDNWALIWAQKQALQKKAPLIVFFCLVPDFLNAGGRQYLFMLKGLAEVEKKLAEKNIPFRLLSGPPESTIPDWVRSNHIKLLVADFDPLRIKKEWKEGVRKSIDIPFDEIDAHNIVPCFAASPKKEYGAYTLRPKIDRLLDNYLDDFPQFERHPAPFGSAPFTEWGKITKKVGLHGNEGEPYWIKPGEDEARQALDGFMENGLRHYNEARNDPTAGGQSDLSPYLHFGQLSAQRVALEVMASGDPIEMKESFLEELIVRRELADNYCFYEPDYDKFSSFPAWARQTLDAHRHDPRPYLYTREELEGALTHDDLWNAAQQEMVKKGKMHGYLRMYWAKKILEWTPSPEAALETAIYLNDRYELDGRDPNGYAGIAWSIGGVHDRAWNERKVFGKIRFMSYNGCRTKFNIKKYIEQIRSMDYP